MADALYTTVIPKPAEMLPGRGFQIVLIAQGAGLLDVTDTYVTNGATFDPLDLRAKAIALLARLNTNSDFVKQIQSIAGVAIDVTPIAPQQPTADDIAVAQFALIVSAWVTETKLLKAQLSDAPTVELARQSMAASFQSAKTPALIARFRAAYGIQVF